MLLERGEVDSPHGRISLSILLFQDLCVIFFLVGLPLLGSSPQGFSIWTLVRAATIMTGLYLFARRLLQPLLLGEDFDILRAREFLHGHPL